MAIKREVVAGVDLGTTKICVLVAEVRENGDAEVIAVGTSPSHGLKQGVVVDLERTIAAIETAVRRAEDLAGFKIDDVYVGIAGTHVLSVNHKACLQIEGKEITKEQVDFLLNEAKSIGLASDREIINMLPIEFCLDGYKGIRDPVGMVGHMLEVDVHIITGASAAIANIVKCVHCAGLKIKELVLQPIASAEAVLLEEEKEIGVILVDIGGGTTDIAVFHKGHICHTAVLPIGGNHVTNDISIGLETSLSEAEALKVKYGQALSCFIDPREKMHILGIGDKPGKEIKTYFFSEIIEARMQEVFQLVMLEIQRSGYQEYWAGGLVVTGGCSLLNGLEALVNRTWGISVRIGTPNKVSGLSQGRISPVYATAVGLTRYGFLFGTALPDVPEPKEELNQNMWQTIKSWFKEFFQDTD